MTIREDLMKYFSQFQDGNNGYGIKIPTSQDQFNQLNMAIPQPPQGLESNNFGQLNPKVLPMGSGGVNQLNTMTDAMSNPIDASKALTNAAQDIVFTKSPDELQKQLITKSIASISNSRPISQQPLKIINAQQAFAQLPDATQPQQVQEFKPDQMAMMLRKRYGSL